MRAARTLGRTLGTLFLLLVVGLALVGLARSCGESDSQHLETRLEDGSLVP